MLVHFGGGDFPAEPVDVVGDARVVVGLGGGGTESYDGKVAIVAAFPAEREVDVGGGSGWWGGDVERGIMSNGWRAVSEKGFGECVVKFLSFGFRGLHKENGSER